VINLGNLGDTDMNKTILLSLALLLAPVISRSMVSDEWLKMRPIDDTSSLFVRQEFCFATGEWVDQVAKDGQAQYWQWDPVLQRYIKGSALACKNLLARRAQEQESEHEREQTDREQDAQEKKEDAPENSHAQTE
jgi:hypothetical protein